jgi:hypothetical protein
MKPYPTRRTVQLFMVLTSSRAGAAMFGAIALGVVALILS